MTRSGPARAAEELVARVLFDADWITAARAIEEGVRVEALASRTGVAIPSEAVERAIDAHRRRRKPASGHAAKAWLDTMSASRAALVRFCHVRLLREALLAALSADDVARWFAEHRADYDAALLSVLTLATEPEAWLARAAAQDDLEAFDDLAWIRTQADPAQPPGGALGWRMHRDLPPIVADAVFATAERGLTDPVLYDRTFHVYRVWRVRPARWTPVVDATCRADLLASLLAGKGDP